MLQSMFQAIQLVLRDYRNRCVRRALNHFRESAITLLCSRLGRMALQAAQEFDGDTLTRKERHHLATARLFCTIGELEIDAEDWIVKALVELAISELEHPAPISALESFYP